MDEMDEPDVDRLLELLFQKALDLSAEEERAFHRRFQSRKVDDRRAWAAFAAVMVRCHHDLRPALNWLNRPQRRLPATG